MIAPQICAVVVPKTIPSTPSGGIKTNDVPGSWIPQVQAIDIKTLIRLVASSTRKGDHMSPEPRKAAAAISVHPAKNWPHASIRRNCTAMRNCSPSIFSSRANPLAIACSRQKTKQPRIGTIVSERPAICRASSWRPAPHSRNDCRRSGADQTEEHGCQPRHIGRQPDRGGFQLAQATGKVHIDKADAERQKLFAQHGQRQQKQLPPKTQRRQRRLRGSVVIRHSVRSSQVCTVPVWVSNHAESIVREKGFRCHHED